MKISTVIITYNEERNIARCIESVLPISDEIVVVDSFSNDSTKSICQQYGVAFIEHAFEGYVEQKNYASHQAQNDWILSLDADECLSEEALASIATIKKEGPKHAAYGFKRLTNYCGKWIYHCGWYPDRKLRLFNRQKAKWTGLNIHEKLSILNPQDRFHFLNADILHYSYYTVEEHLKQSDRFTSISARTLFSQGKKASLIKRYLSPIFKFFKDYLIRLGFLDGYFGWKICLISAQASYLKYHKLHLMNKGLWNEGSNG